MAAAGMSTVGRIRPAYAADTHALSQEGGAFKLRAMALPALNASLSSHSRKPRQRSLWTGDARVRRITRPLETSSGRMVSVSCSINGPGDTSSSSSSPSVPEGDLPLRDGDGDDFASGSAAIWDLQLLQAVAARIGDPLRDILSSASRRLQTYFDSYRKPKPDQEDEAEPEKPAVQKEEWDWERWREHFVHVEEQEKRASILKFHLEGAVRDEDFREAARLKCALRAATANDPVSEVLAELKKALEEESYEYATRLRDEAAAGLVGWWVGLAEGENDPYGRIINISSSYGRFIAKGYTARQLASASAGTSLFEVFIRKDPEGYHQQAVYLQRGGIGDSAPGTSSSIDVNIDVNIVDMNALTEDGKEIKAKDLAEAFGDEKEKSGDASVSDDGLSSIINFLKDRIPDVKLKVFRVIAQNGEDIPKIVEQILEEVETQEGEGAKGHKEIEGPTEEVLQEAKDKAGENSELVQEVHKEIPVRLIVGGMLQNATEDKLSKAPTRIRARIETQSRDSFLFHIEEIAAQQSPAKESVPSLKVATFMTQASADVPPEIAKVVSNLEKIPVKVSKDMGEFLKLAVSQVQRRRGLSKCTSFERIKLTGSNTDPLAGLYIGAFGPYTSELVQLRQKYGHWHGESDISNFKNNLEFFEYVEAVKLTGDLNVPAGQVTFRAKIGKDSRLSHRGFYPEELGVIARYKGQGRLAEPGFKNPQWVDGELLLLDGKGFGHLNGAELGFIYSVPERHFLVLFNRLKLQVK